MDVIERTGTVGPQYVLEFGEVMEGIGPDASMYENEWLLTNGLGGFAMGTVGGLGTRRYHGMLNAAMRPPVQRVNTLNAVNEVLVVGGERYELGFNEYVAHDRADVFHPGGWRLLRKFEKDEVVRWTYRVGALQVVKQLRLVWKRSLGVLTYRVEPAVGIAGSGVELPGEVVLELKPLVGMRDFHHLGRKGEVEEFAVEEADGQVMVTGAGLPVLYMRVDGGTFREERDWWYGFKRRAESARQQDDVEDLFTPGEWDCRFENVGGSVCEVNLYFGTEPLEMGVLRGDDGRAALLAEQIAHVEVQVEDGVDLSGLVVAGNDFVVEREVGGKKLASILAGYPWFADWGRDTMISLPGLLLCTGRYEDARATLFAYARSIRRGLVPNRFDDYGGEPHYNTVDASMWFVHAALEYVRLSGDEGAWREVLAGACGEIIEWYMKGTDGDIYMDEDGLISAGNGATQLTWMDAKRDGVVFTPRQGKAVEINALWYRALVGCGEAMKGVDAGKAQEYTNLAEGVGKAFIKTFWDERLGYLVDCVDGERRDDSLRCNQVIAVSMKESPLTDEMKRSVMETARRELLTEMGMRTLSRQDEEYRGRYAGSMFERDAAYHRGTVWAWPVGHYVEGYLRAYGFGDEAVRHGREALGGLLEEVARHSLGQLHEVFDGDEPHWPGGCTAQAWSVAEVLRAGVLVWGK